MCYKYICHSDFDIEISNSAMETLFLFLHQELETFKSFTTGIDHSPQHNSNDGLWLASVSCDVHSE